jgi:hypothetical protein
VVLVPFYKLFGQRYGIYWKSYTEPQWQKVQEQVEQAKVIALEKKSRLIDEIRIGSRSATRSEREHDFNGVNVSRGRYMDKNWVQADPNGWFSYKMKVLGDNAVSLVLTYWGADVGDREFDIIVEEKVIATQKIHELGPGQFIDIEYQIPKELTLGREFVTVKIKPYPANTAGGVFGVAILRAKTQ